MADYTNYFRFTYEVRDLLFKGITVSSVGAMVGLCIGVAIFTALYESTKSFRQYLVITFLNDRSIDSVVTVDNSDGRSSRKFGFFRRDLFSKRNLRRLKFHLLQTLMYMLQLAMGYMVMLMVMSYNAWLLLTVIFTTALCYYLHSYLMDRKPLVVPVEAAGSNL